jgi:glycerol-3-phosphate dehydrogenase
LSDASGPGPLDLFIVGGGVNGCGIAREAVGRGLKVALAEQGDIAQATSSASTKLFHGGLRYLEYSEVHLVREALRERETLLVAMPHISWPMRFILPYAADMRFESDTPTSHLLGLFMPWTKGRRPAWLIRLGLLLYDTLGGRKILPATRTLDLHKDPAGAFLQDRFEHAYEYSDCWVEDAKLVSLNARDAAERGATIMTRTRVVAALRRSDDWLITTQSGGVQQTHIAKVLVNATGPWVQQFSRDVAAVPTTDGVRLVRGSHIVTRRLYDHDRCYFFQGTDGRIIFAIPYEQDFTLIGTTEEEHHGSPGEARISDAERDYLLDFASRYFKRPVVRDDIVWTYSGVRPLYNDGARSATAATREYVLTLDTVAAPLLNVFGGKITTYRRLAEAVLVKLAPCFPGLRGAWTARQPLPGGDFPYDKVASLVAALRQDYAFLSDYWARRLVRAYGTEARTILGSARVASDLGIDFGATLTATEVDWLVAHEFARMAEDIVWRRTKLGLRMTPDEIDRLRQYLENGLRASPARA